MGFAPSSKRLLTCSATLATSSGVLLPSSSLTLQSLLRWPGQLGASVERRARAPSRGPVRALRFWYGSLRLFVDVFREYDSYWLGVGRGQYFNLAMALAGLWFILRAHLLARHHPTLRSPSLHFRASDPGRRREGALGAKVALFAVLVVSCLFIPSGWTQQALAGFEQRATEGFAAGSCPMVTGSN
jgi:hypothetical protein